MWFNADVADDMPWEFEPIQEYVRVRPGQSTLVFFRAKNKRCEHMMCNGDAWCRIKVVNGFCGAGADARLWPAGQGAAAAAEAAGQGRNQIV